MNSNQNPSTVWVRPRQNQIEPETQNFSLGLGPPCTGREIRLAAFGKAAVVAGPTLILFGNLFQTQTGWQTSLVSALSGTSLMAAGALMSASANRSVSNQEASLREETLSALYRPGPAQPPL